MIEKIVIEIDQLLRGKFPELANSLNAPATDSEIAAFEKKLGHKLPVELRQLYKIHNGESDEVGLFFGLPFLSLEAAMREWEVWASIANEGESSLDTNISSVPDNHIKENYANKNYIPFIEDFGGNNIGIDLDPGAKGMKGQVINFGRDEEMRFVVAENLSDFLTFVLENLKSNNYTIIRNEEDIRWYLKEPKNEHFLDVLSQLDLPFGTTVASAVRSEEDYNYWFNNLDHVWQKAVENQVRGKKTFESVEKTRSLLLIRNDINNEILKTISEFKGLKEVILTDNPISDIAPLFKLEKLTKLYLASTEIENADQLKHLHSLTQLSLYNTKMNSFAGLSEMKKLKDLGMGNSGLKNLDEISLMKSLTVLNISDNKLDDFEPLAELKI